MSSIRCSVSANRSIKDCFTPFAFAASISFAFSCKINSLSSTSSFATARSPLFFAFVPSFAASRDALFASLPSICMYVSISVTPFISLPLNISISFHSGMPRHFCNPARGYVESIPHTFSFFYIISVFCFIFFTY